MAKTRTKVQELSIFSCGVGVVVCVLTLWLSVVMRPEPGRHQSVMIVALPILFGVVLIVLGVLTRKVASRAIVVTTVIVVMLGFVADMVVAFHPGRAVVDGLIVAFIAKSGLEAYREISPAPCVE